MELAVADIYARGLYGAAQDAGNTTEVRNELIQLNKILKANKEFYRFLVDPGLSRVVKKDKINRIFRGRITDTTMNFLFILVDKGRVSSFRAIAYRYTEIDDDEHNVAEGVIESAVPLTDEQLKKFNSQVGEFYGKKIELKNVVDKSLIGGVKIYAEDRLIDASLSSRLEELQDRIQRG